MNKSLEQGVRVGSFHYPFLLVCALPSLLFTGVSLSAQSRILSGHVPWAVKATTPLKRLPQDQPLDLVIGLPLRNQEELTQLLARIYDPMSSDYRHYLTPEQFTERFGPTDTEYQNLIRFALSRNLTVTRTHSNRMLLEVNAHVADIESAFQIRLNVYAHPTEARVFYAPETDPLVQDSLSISDISGLDDYVLPHPISLHARPLLHTPKPFFGSGSDGTYMGGDFRAAYAPGVTLGGTGQSIGLLEFDGYYSSDITSYESQAGLKSVPLENVLLNRVRGTPGPNNVEVALDIEVAIAMAPTVSQVIVYEGTQPNSILNQMATDNAAKQLSSSWSYTITTTTEQIFQEFAAQGQTMFQASGDNGAYSGLVDAPCDDPNLTIVGGTTLSTSGPRGQWVSETAWSWANSGIGTNATGGGVSTVYALPSWQQGIAGNSSQASNSKRNLPDVAMTADDVMVIYNNGSKGIFGGTSVAAPLWAGFMALINQQATAGGKPAVGFLNPSIYRFAKSSGYASGFHDIFRGNNTNAVSPTRFSAVLGYDLCTGWGTPVGQSLINALSGLTNSPPVSVPVHIQTTATGNVISLNWSGGNPPYQVQMSGNLSLTNWSTLATTSNTTFTASRTNMSGFYRIVGQ